MTTITKESSLTSGKVYFWKVNGRKKRLVQDIKEYFEHEPEEPYDTTNDVNPGWNTVVFRLPITHTHSL